MTKDRLPLAELLRKAGDADFSRTEHFTFRKEVKPKLVGLKLTSSAPVALEEW